MVDEADRRPKNGGKDPKTGRFLAGNPGGGRLKAEFTLQALIDEAVSADDWRAMIARRRACAMGLDLTAKPDDEATAFKELANRRWGMPKAEIDATLHAGPSVEAVLLAMQAAQQRLGGG